MDKVWLVESASGVMFIHKTREGAERSLREILYDWLPDYEHDHTLEIKVGYEDKPSFHGVVDNLMDVDLHNAEDIGVYTKVSGWVGYTLIPHEMED